jgi:hypothetical protein
LLLHITFGIWCFNAGLKIEIRGSMSTAGFVSSERIEEAPHHSTDILNDSRFTTGATRAMDSRPRKMKLMIILTCCLILPAIASSYASEHRESRSHFGKGNEQAEGREEGVGGASGQIAAWLFGIANFPVVLSILLKAYGKISPKSSNSREAVSQLNRQQKHYLMRLHYWLNPVAVGIAIIHFLSAKCEATAIPEIGLGAMLLICILGIMVTFKWSPASMRKAIFRFHTSSISLLAIISILLIGHSMVD